MLNHERGRDGGGEREGAKYSERERKRRELGRKEGMTVRGRQTDLAPGSVGQRF